MCTIFDFHLINILQLTQNRVSAGLLLPGPEDHPMQSLGMLGNTINLPNSQTSLPLSGISNSLGTNRLPQHKHNLGLQTATVDDGTQREAVHQLRDVVTSHNCRSMPPMLIQKIIGSFKRKSFYHTRHSTAPSVSFNSSTL